MLFLLIVSPTIWIIDSSNTLPHQHFPFLALASPTSFFRYPYHLLSGQTNAHWIDTSHQFASTFFFAFVKAPSVVVTNINGALSLNSLPFVFMASRTSRHLTTFFGLGLCHRSKTLVIYLMTFDLVYSQPLPVSSSILIPDSGLAYTKQ